MTCPECKEPLELALMCSGPSGCGGMKAEEGVEWLPPKTHFWGSTPSEASFRLPTGTLELYAPAKTNLTDEWVWLWRRQPFMYFDTEVEAKAAGELLVRVLRVIFGESK